jgi:pimeloyl-ACP methyl ester carboxylesterase
MGYLALDLEGFGLSTRPVVMGNPAAFPDSKAPIHADVSLRDVERVVDFIMALRGVEQVHLLGWSQALPWKLRSMRVSIQRR